LLKSKRLRIMMISMRTNIVILKRKKEKMIASKKRKKWEETQNLIQLFTKISNLVEDFHQNRTNQAKLQLKQTPQRKSNQPKTTDHQCNNQ
jgi:hypothetical protein